MSIVQLKGDYSQRQHSPEILIGILHSVRWCVVLVLRFHSDNIGIAPFVALHSLHLPKILNFMDALHCYKQK